MQSPAVVHSPSLQLQFRHFISQLEDSWGLIFGGISVRDWNRYVSSTPRGTDGCWEKRIHFFKIKQLSEYDRQYNRNKITYLLFLCGPVPNDPRTGTGPRPSVGDPCSTGQLVLTGQLPVGLCLWYEAAFCLSVNSARCIDLLMVWSLWYTWQTAVV